MVAYVYRFVVTSVVPRKLTMSEREVSLGKCGVVTVSIPFHSRLECISAGTFGVWLTTCYSGVKANTCKPRSYHPSRLVTTKCIPTVYPFAYLHQVLTETSLHLCNVSLAVSYRELPTNLNIVFAYFIQHPASNTDVVTTRTPRPWLSRDA